MDAAIASLICLVRRNTVWRIVYVGAATVIISPKERFRAMDFFNRMQPKTKAVLNNLLERLDRDSKEMTQEQFKELLEWLASETQARLVTVCEDLARR